MGLISKEHQINITSKDKKSPGIIEKLGGVCKGISCQAIKKLYTLYVPPLNLQMEEACDRFAIRYDRAVSLNNPYLETCQRQQTSRV